VVLQQGFMPVNFMTTVPATIMLPQQSYWPSSEVFFHRLTRYQKVNTLLTHIH